MLPAGRSRLKCELGGVPNPGATLSTTVHAVHEDAQLARGEGGPGFVVGERLGGHHRHPVGGAGVGGEIHAQVGIGQSCCTEGVLAHQPVQARRAMRPKCLAVGQQQVEAAMGRRPRQQLGQGAGEFGHRGHRGMGLGQLLHQPAEGVLGVGVAHRAEGTVQRRAEAGEVAVVGEHPVAAPQLAHERMGVLQRHPALRGLADVGDDVAAVDRVALHQLGHRRAARAVVVDEQAHAAVFEEGDAEAVLVLVGTLRQAGEAEHHVGGRVGIHAEQLAHGCEARVRESARTGAAGRAG